MWYPLSKAPGEDIVGVVILVVVIPKVVTDLMPKHWSSSDSQTNHTIWKIPIYYLGRLHLGRHVTNSAGTFWVLHDQKCN